MALPQSRYYSFLCNKKSGRLQAFLECANGGAPTCGRPKMLSNQFKHIRCYNKDHWNEKFELLQKVTCTIFSRFHLPKDLFFESRPSKIFLAMTKKAGTTYTSQTSRCLSMTLCSVSFKFPYVGNIARSVSLAFSLSHVAPRILAFLISPLPWTCHRRAGAEALRNNSSLYSQSLDRRAIFTAHMCSLLEGLILILRMFYLLMLFSPSVLAAPLAFSFEGRFRELWLKLVREALENAGAAFIKWGQWAATRPDLFPSDLCTELSKLHSKAPAHNFAYTRKTIENAFGRTIDEIFDDFEQEPVASGSIAQVLKASLRFRYPGQKMKPITVAVKVRHPGVTEVIRRDFVIINWIAKVTSYFPPLRWLRLEESVQQFAVFMLSQVDLAREAAHLSRFISNFRKWRDVSFPSPLYPLVHPAVLVETYEQGESVANYVEQPQSDHRLNKSLAHIGTHTLLKMLLVDNFIHADMHPGNILVRVAKDNLSSKRLFRSKPHVIFLDVGMTAELSSNDRVNLLEFFKAVAIRDGRAAAECTLKFSRNQSCPDRDSFIREVEESFKFWGSPEGEMVHPAECMQHLLDQVRRYKVNIDGNVCTVMVTTLVLQGWQRKLDPDYNIMDTLQKLLFKVDWANSLSYSIEGLMAP